jgi:ABC-type uncharacterized transport system permease subunit
MTSILLLCTALAYAAGAIMFAQQTMSMTTLPKPLKSGILYCFIFFALGSHGYILNAELFHPREADLSMVNIANLLSWCMVLVLLVVGKMLGNLTLLPVTLGFSALCALLMLLPPGTQPVIGSLAAGSILHIVLSLTAYGCVVVALMYAYQMRFIHKKLKSKALALSGLPPLLHVETWVYRLIGLGSILLAFALFSGFATSESMFTQQHAHKTVLSLIALIVFFTALILHKRIGLSTKHLTTLTAIGVILLTIGYFGSRFVREFLL